MKSRLVAAARLTASARLVALTALVLLASCGQDQTTVDVFVASSLTDAFAQLEDEYEDAHPDIDIRVSVAGSNTLLRQIVDGAEADVFASADAGLLLDTALVAEHPDLETSELALNALVAIVPADSDITSAGELFGPGITTARCAAGVPCGDLLDALLDQSGQTLGRASIESSVRAVLTKVRLGVVDGGFVYATDAISAGPEVRVVPLGEMPESISSIANLEPGNAAATAFVVFTLSAEGQLVLAELGFDRP